MAERYVVLASDEQCEALYETIASVAKLGADVADPIYNRVSIDAGSGAEAINGYAKNVKIADLGSSILDLAQPGANNKLRFIMFHIGDILHGSMVAISDDESLVQSLELVRDNATARQLFMYLVSLGIDRPDTQTP